MSFFVILSGGFSVVNRMFSFSFDVDEIYLEFYVDKSYAMPSHTKSFCIQIDGVTRNKLCMFFFPSI